MAYTAVFGGTFNPPHMGHYQMLEALENSETVEKILLMPDRVPPHKICDFLAADSERIEMCRIMAQDFSKAVMEDDDCKEILEEYDIDEILPEHVETAWYVCGFTLAEPVKGSVKVWRIRNY